MKITAQEKQLILKRRKIHSNESNDIGEYNALLSQSIHGLDQFTKLMDKANKFAQTKFHEDLLKQIQNLMKPIIQQRTKLEKDMHLAIETIDKLKLKIGND